MSFDDEVILIWNKVENEQITEKQQYVFANIQSVTGQEFYAAYQSGISPGLIIAINTDDYELTKVKDELGRNIYAKLIRYDDGAYDIIRHYSKNGVTYLTCS